MIKTCPYCKTLVTKTYQGQACKSCLLTDFKRLRPLQDSMIGNRYTPNPVSNSLSDSTQRSPLPFREGDNPKYLTGVESVGLGQRANNPKPIPWLHFHRKRYLTSTYPRKY